MESLRGQLLVAAPSLLDPNFARTVVLIAEHTEEGALGVVLNRASPTTIGEVVPDLADFIDADDPVFAGGPVQSSGVIVIAEFDDPEQAALRIQEDLGFVAMEAEVGEVRPAVRRARAFAGHAGWGPGQLDAEIEEDSWFVAPFMRDDAFTDEPDELWSSALLRKGGAYALVARMPLDPSLN